MASSRESVSPFGTPSTATALCLIPPQHLWEPVDRLRSLHDKAYDRWPPHVNLLYPFVEPNHLRDAVAAIVQHLAQSGTFDRTPRHVALQDVDVFNHKHDNTLFLRPESSGDSEDAVTHVARQLREALGRPVDEQFTPHLTVAQTYDSQSASHSYLLEKVRALVGLSWDATEIAVLVRDSGHGLASSTQGSMKVWGYISLDTLEVKPLPAPKALYPQADDASVTAVPATSQASYQFSSAKNAWVALDKSQPLAAPEANLDRLIVASYNVLGEFQWPPNQERYPKLVANIVSDRGAADILVLEEVTDDFLQYLLNDSSIRSRYPYSTHGPPETGPLPNHLNIVVLSKFELTWSHLPFQRKHKGAVIVTFPTLTTLATSQEDSQNLPLILAACHLTKGLVDAAIICKKNELTRLFSHLSANYASHPQIIAGDFNMPTSSYTIEKARKTRHLSSEQFRYVRGFDASLADAGLQDTWLASRIQSGESPISPWMQEPSAIIPEGERGEGEQGATFDPQNNDLAAKLVGTGLNNRPQRYDRILVNDHIRLHPSRFNMFGVPGSDKEYADASDHWGIRSLLAVQATTKHNETAHVRPIELRHAPASLGGLKQLKSMLQHREILPMAEDASERQGTVHMLERILQGHVEGGPKPDDSRGPQFVLAPVGSFALGVWTPTSDLDLLCIGSISSKTFMRLAVSRLRKAASRGVTILGKIRAASGTMLQLDVRGIRVDLHYCAATRILEQFPDALKRPPTDPIFSLPVQTLQKLKPLRDVFYLCRSIPDMTQYRVAHLLIKAWAKSRGLYGPKYGLLGGIHIAVLLVPVCKILAKDAGSVTVGDILVTFFHHYARFDWKTQVVFDPFFHSVGVNHRRLEREPLCLLGWHGPALNTALNASAPTVHTIATELRRADSLLSQADITWEGFLGLQENNLSGDGRLDAGGADFLKAYKRYVRIDVNYWGSSSQKRNGLVGWLESRCVMLLVDLDRRVPAFTARIWPQRFMDRLPSSQMDPDLLDYHGCYLIGLETAQPSQRTKGQDSSSAGELERVLEQFADRIRGDDRYYDPNTCWMGATVVQGSKLGDLQLDKSHVSDHAGGYDLDDDLSSDEEDEPDEDDEDTDAVTGLPTRPRTTGIGNQPTTKLRSSIDVMHRIRWDPNLDSADFIVGYEDRFTGIQERNFDLWKSELTDEEFIPQHRVMYFKRRSDGEVVWDRRSRVDKVFGSGISTEILD